MCVYLYVGVLIICLLVFNVLEGLHHEALEENCLRMNVSATVYKTVKIYVRRWS